MDEPAFKCGHPKTSGNIIVCKRHKTDLDFLGAPGKGMRKRCRACYNALQAAAQRRARRRLADFKDALQASFPIDLPPIEPC